MATAMHTGAVHAETARLNVREIVRQLNGALGATLVATLAGNKDSKISYRWAREDGPVPKDESVARLQLAHRAWSTLSAVEGEHVARMWFIGANPWLGEVSPVQAIRDNRSKDVMNAVTAMVEDRFAG